MTIVNGKHQLDPGEEWWSRRAAGEIPYFDTFSNALA